MKVHYKYVSVILIFGLVACYRDDVLTENQYGKAGPVQRCLRNGDQVKMVYDPKLRHKITPERAERIAINASSVFDDRVNTRSLSTKSVYSVEPVLSASINTRAAINPYSADTLMYVVNFTDSQGYAIVSFDDRDGEVLMYSDGGNLDMNRIMAANPENDIMRFHVDMIMAQQGKLLDSIRKVEASGKEYLGQLEVKKLSADEFDNIITELTEDPYGEVSTRAGIPGSGLPGAPGIPQAGCIPYNFQIIGWDGNPEVVSMLQNKYKNSRCFGVTVPPPQIDFNPQGVPGVDAPPCPYPPYCDPPIVDYNGYYEHYGATVTAMYEAPLKTTSQTGPLLTTTWHQGAPLNRYCYYTGLLSTKGSDSDNVSVGCGPLAMAQIMVYHGVPTHFGSSFQYKPGSGYREYKLHMDELRKLETNEDISSSDYWDEAAIFVREIGNRANAKYFNGGTALISLKGGSWRIRDVFKGFGYTIGYGDQHYNYKKYFAKARESIKANMPVFIYGYPVSKNGSGPILYFQGHCWVLDGIKVEEKIKYYITYKFDEYGNFNSYDEHEAVLSRTEYVHANMGWSDPKNQNGWILYRIYRFDDVEYAEIDFIPGIKPK